MKTLFVVLLVLGFARTAGATKKEIAEVSDMFFETEVENVEIKELEGQRETAHEEKLKQESAAKQAARELAEAKQRRKHTEKKTRESIVRSENRRMAAEKTEKKDRNETALHEKEINRLERQAERYEFGARLAEEKSQQAKMNLEEAKSKKKSAALRRDTSVVTKEKYEKQVHNLTTEYRATNGETDALIRESKRLEAIIQNTAKVVGKAQAMLANAQQRKDQAQTRRDETQKELKKVQSDLKNLDAQYRKTLIETQKLQLATRANVIEIQKQQAYMEHKKQLHALAKTRGQQAKINNEKTKIRVPASVITD